jgi:hypothetical protein
MPSVEEVDRAVKTAKVVKKSPAKKAAPKKAAK